METEAALVRTDGAVHLHAEAPVDLHLAAVVHPGNAEDDDALRFDHALEDFLVQQMRIGHHIGSYALYHFTNCLMKFDLARIAGYEVRHEAVDILLSQLFHNTTNFEQAKIVKDYVLWPVEKHAGLFVTGRSAILVLTPVPAAERQQLPEHGGPVFPHLPGIKELFVVFEPVYVKGPFLRVVARGVPMVRVDKRHHLVVFFKPEFVLGHRLKQQSLFPPGIPADIFHCYQRQYASVERSTFEILGKNTPQSADSYREERIHQIGLADIKSVFVDISHKRVEWFDGEDKADCILGIADLRVWREHGHFHPYFNPVFFSLCLDMMREAILDFCDVNAFKIRIVIERIIVFVNSYNTVFDFFHNYENKNLRDLTAWGIIDAGAS